MSSSVNCFSNLPAPPVSIVGWNSATEIANQLANALVDTNTFTIVGATYSSTSTRSAGLATFRQYGTCRGVVHRPNPGYQLAQTSSANARAGGARDQRYCAVGEAGAGPESQD